MFEQLCQTLHDHQAIEGVTIIEVTQYPEPLGSVLRVFLRNKAYSLNTLADRLAYTLDEMQMLVNLLLIKGFLKVSINEQNNELLYRLRLISTHGRKIPGSILKAIEED